MRTDPAQKEFNRHSPIPRRIPQRINTAGYLISIKFKMFNVGQRVGGQREFTGQKIMEEVDPNAERKQKKWPDNYLFGWLHIVKNLNFQTIR